MAFALPPLTPASALSDGLVPHVTSRGVAFMQLYQRMGPVGEYLYAPFEKSYDTNRAPSSRASTGGCPSSWCRSIWPPSSSG
jgi:hypothetical protein